MFNANLPLCKIPNHFALRELWVSGMRLMDIPAPERHSDLKDAGSA
jgi:hypothetical protein